jgi:16S rRNA (cytosine1402-N4)-methyltransferase
MNHVPVLLKETNEFLAATTGSKFIDATAGSGGHIFGLLSVNVNAKILGVDLDQVSLDDLKAEVTQRDLNQKIILVQGNYKNLDKIVSEENFGLADGILLDLGFSSTQVDDPERGFSFQQEAQLDMRYDQSANLTAFKVVNAYSKDELAEIFTEYSEERFSKRIASYIVEARKIQPIKTTFDLADIVKQSLPANLRYKANDNLRRIFQAIRIEVNSELDNLKDFLPKAFDLLNPQGRLVIISFHSLEDRIVKNYFKELSLDCICPPQFPTCVCDKVSNARILTKKPITASEEEVENNPRSKSAKLRAIEKIN